MNKKPSEMTTDEVISISDQLIIASLHRALEDVSKLVDQLEGVEMPYPLARDLAAANQHAKRILEQHAADSAH